jgi:hypothetical protein
MTISTKAKVRFALLSTFATVATTAVVVACGNGDDDDTSSPKTDASAKLDSTTPATDSGGGGADTSTPVDSAVVDAAPDAADAAATPVSCAGYLYCDDFESYPDSGTIANNTKLGPWTTGVGGKTDAGQTIAMGVDTVRPFSGSYALHLTAPAGESTYGQLQRAAGGDAGDIGGNLYGRAMVYFSGAPLPGGSAPLTDASTYGLPSGVHSWLFASSGHSPELDASVSANIIVGNPKFALNYSPGDYGPGSTPDAGPVTTGAWHCLQWQYDGSDASPDDVMNVWFDGLQVVHTDRSMEYSNNNFPVKTWLKMASDWNSLTFGFTHYQTMENPVDVYLDDFAVNDAMVPCPTTP